MADRLAQYPMLPSSNFNANLLQQQQISQSQVDPQSFSNADNGRGWQNQYRSQQPPASQQMADVLRNTPTMARLQGQQQMGQQQMGQQFALGPQMGTQQTSFHDQATQQSQPHASNFPNMASNASQMQLNRSAMLAYQTNNPAHMRQLELMSMTQNHQPQNGPVNYNLRLAQQQQQQHQTNMNNSPGQNQSTQADIFASPSISSAEGVRSSPSHSIAQPTVPIGNQQSSMPQNSQGPPAGRRSMTFQELRDRAQQLQAFVNHHEQLLIQLTNSRAAIPEAEYMQKVRALTNEIKHRKEFLSKVIQAMGAFAPNINGPSPGNVGNMHPVNGSPLQQANSVQNGQNLSSWISQPGPSQPQGLGNSQMGGQGTPHIQSQTHNPQSSPHQLQAQANPSQQQHLVPPRSGPTPQLLGGQISPNMAPQFAFMNGGQGAQPRAEQNSQNSFMPPLEKTRFDSAYANYCNSKGITHDNRLMVLENRPIDLHSLHVQVMSEGGGAKVNQKELWAVIGARMGFVQLAGTDSEPAKSGPGVAQHLAHVYKEYLSTFDNVYIHSVMESKRKLQATAAVHQTLTAGPNASRTIPVTSSHQMQTVMAYANTSAADLRVQGVPEKIIQFVEQNRIHIQRTTQQQNAFRGMVLKPTQPGPPGEPSEQDRMPPAQFALQTNPSFPQVLPNSAVRPQHFIPPNHGMSPLANSNNIDTQFPRQSQQPGPQGVSNGAAPLNRAPRPSDEQLQHAMSFITRTKQDFVTRSIQNMQPQAVPDEQRMEFKAMIEQLFRHTKLLENKLPMYCIMLNKQEEMIRKLIAIILTVQHQRNLLSSSPTPKYIVDLNTLHLMVTQIQHANELFNNMVHMMANKQPATAALSNGQSGPGMSQARPPIPRPPSQAAQQSIPPPPPSRSVSMTQPLSGKKPPTRSVPSNTTITTSAAISTPTPPPIPSASTPATSAPTPTQTASSPQGAKSPKSKPTPKPRAVATTKRKPSKNIPATPEVAAPPPPVAGAGSKRAREEEITSSGSSATSNELPSPKRVKTEWEGPPSEALEKKQEEIANIKTEDDANAFFERMTELIKLADGKGEESLTSDIAETLDLILKGCGAVPDGPENSSMSLGLSDSLGLHNSSPQPKPPLDEFVEFFDFSSFGTIDDDDAGSKAPTPDLVSSSSTNPSPESGSEVDATGHGAVELKTEDLDPSDPLRLGQWKEIDGGESAYYHQPDHWKWDSPMPTSEPPWAVFTT